MWAATMCAVVSMLVLVVVSEGNVVVARRRKQEVMVAWPKGAVRACAPQ